MISINRSQHVFRHTYSRREDYLHANGFRLNLDQSGLQVFVQPMPGSAEVNPNQANSTTAKRMNTLTAATILRHTHL